ncbi:MAG: hypothetical protein M4579_003317 [Chaenotheca gracillima]|nr:MAG: hypothetical protein M4579_003317 [Chaenotheca gracillima]
MSADSEDDDDLDIIRVVNRDPKVQHAPEAPGPRDPPKAESARDSETESDDPNGNGSPLSGDDGKTVYENFKSRKSLKRKREGASRRKAKALATEQAKVPARKAKQPRNYGDVEEDEPSLDVAPEYVRRRKASFEKNRDRLQEAGLKLPPNYEDIDFSDDERLGQLDERPQNILGKPSRTYKDIPLPFSLGVIPAPLAQWLREYQVDGVAFLHELFVYQKGGVLGDDMGLGKTIQVIAFLAVAFGKTGDGRDAKRMRKMRRARDGRWYPRVLIICPGSLIQNWKAEIRRWGWWHVDVFHGETKETALDAARAGRLEIMITTYTTYRLNKDTVNMIEWDCVIADECHTIKERTSEISKAMNEVNGLCRIGLTGTAIQNKYEELWTLLNWTNPGRFGPLSTWKTSISEPLRIGQSHDATTQQLSKARKTATKLVENLLPEFFLRRMKSLIADQLPKKSDKVVFCPLTDTQQDAYERYLESDVVQYIKTAGYKCGCASGKKRGWCCYTHIPGGARWQNYVFPAIAYLQKLSNHLAILIPQGQDHKDKQAKDLATLQICVPDGWKELYQNRDSIINYSNADFCGKWKVLRKLLRFWHSSGDKVLIFSHSVRLLKMLQMLFNHTSYNVSYLDGSLTYEDRASTVDDFNSNPEQFVFLISTKAGGVGLNITSANKVVIVDPNWNPSYDLQAQDRAYRIGQVRDVEVFRLVSAGTIEEIVYARQIYKQQQANIGYNASKERRYFTGVQEKKDQKGEIFGLQNLFSFHGENVILRDIVNKTNVAESRAGIDVVGLEVDEAAEDLDDPLNTDDDDADSAMSQLAALVKGEKDSDAPSSQKSKRKKVKKTDAINAILASAGVDYTHENAEVIGSSKVEARLSRRAEEADTDLDKMDEYVFSREDEVAEHEQALGNGSPAHYIDLSRPYKYHPPQNVMKRQFCTMARTFGFNDATEFALVAEGWTQAQRRNCLDQFYKRRRDRVAEMEKEKGDQLGLEEGEGFNWEF